LDSTIPEFSPTHQEESYDFPKFIGEINTLLGEYVADMEAVRLRDGLKKVMEISSKGNEFLQSRIDNKNLLENPVRTHTVLGLALNLVYLLASIASPYMPAVAQSIIEQLNAPLAPIPDKWSAGQLASGHKIGKAAILFAPIDPAKEEEWRRNYGGTQASRAAEEAAKAQKAADKLRDKERKKARKAAAAVNGEASVSGSKEETAKEEGEKLVLPLRGAVAEEQAS